MRRSMPGRILVLVAVACARGASLCVFDANGAGLDLRCFCRSPSSSSERRSHSSVGWCLSDSAASRGFPGAPRSSSRA